MGYQADMDYIPANVLLLFSNFSPKDTLGFYPLWGSLVDENRINTSIYPNHDILPVIFQKVVNKGSIKEIVEPRG